MNVSLTPQLEAWIEAKIASGRYSSASEVVREALRLLEEDDQLRELRLAQARAEIRAGLDDLQAGRVDALDMKAIKASARKKKSRRGKKA